MISPLHGGLVFKDEETKQSDNQGPSLTTNLKHRDINEFFNPIPSSLPLEDRVRLCMQVGEEVIGHEKLPQFLSENPTFRCYDGFEPSGRMHIAQGIMKAINANRITNAGGVFIFWVADWFALLNNKMGGDLEKI